MNRKFHFSLGLSLFIMYIYALINASTLFPGIFTALKAPGMFHGDPHISVLFALLMPFFSILCLMFPVPMSRWFSPKTSRLGDPVLSPGAWIILGYFSFVLSAIMLSVYS
jgi:hypothetical protein